MTPPPSPEAIATDLLATKNLTLLSLTPIQSLWAGYGQICRLTAAPKPNTTAPSKPKDSGLSTPLDQQIPQTYILKLTTPPPTPSSAPPTESHTRKLLSYAAERHFYTRLAPLLPASIPVADCLASSTLPLPDGNRTTALLLSDLKQEFPVAGGKREALDATQAYAALDWLAGFHGFWWEGSFGRVGEFERGRLVRAPLEELERGGGGGDGEGGRGVWLNGGYTYLATRREEWDSLVGDGGSEWSEALTEAVDGEGDGECVAEVVAEVLAPSADGHGAVEDYVTLIHGDVKSENLFASATGEAVAFYDFQYVGLGLGVCDLAKLFTCSVPLGMLVEGGDVPNVLTMQEGEKELLERYWKRLRDMGKREYEWEVFVRHWETALVDWLRFQASWGFWGNTEWLEARVRSILADSLWKQWLLRARVQASVDQK